MTNSALDSADMSLIYSNGYPTTSDADKVFALFSCLFGLW